MHKITKESGGINVSNFGSTGGGINVVQGHNNKQYQTVINSGKSTEEKDLSQAEVITQLAEIEEIIKTSALPKKTKEDVTSFLSAAKTAIDKDEPKKNLALPNLEEVSTTLENVGSALDSGKNIWEKVKPILIPIFTWLGGSLV